MKWRITRTTWRLSFILQRCVHIFSIHTLCLVGKQSKTKDACVPSLNVSVETYRLYVISPGRHSTGILITHPSHFRADEKFRPMMLLFTSCQSWTNMKYFICNELLAMLDSLDGISRNLFSLNRILIAWLTDGWIEINNIVLWLPVYLSVNKSYSISIFQPKKTNLLEMLIPYFVGSWRLMFADLIPYNGPLPVVLFTAVLYGNTGGDWIMEQQLHAQASYITSSIKVTSLSDSCKSSNNL